MPITSPYETSFDVHADDIDELGHVNNVVYLRWVQDTAIRHWRAAAPTEEQDRLFWVVVRHEIDYLRPALESDRIVAKTWVGTASRLRFNRHTELRRESGGKVLARAVTTWCPMDRSTRRPSDVSDGIRELFSDPDPESW